MVKIVNMYMKDSKKKDTKLLIDKLLKKRSKNQ